VSLTDLSLALKSMFHVYGFQTRRASQLAESVLYLPSAVLDAQQRLDSNPSRLDSVTARPLYKDDSGSRVEDGVLRTQAPC